jgi:hypothetical protein
MTFNWKDILPTPPPTPPPPVTPPPLIDKAFSQKTN